MQQIKVSEFKSKGFVLRRNFFPRDAVERIRQDAKRVFQTQMLRRGILESEDVSEDRFEHGLYTYFRRSLEEFINCGKQIQHLISLHRLSLDDRILNVLEQLGLRFPNISTRPVLYFNNRRLAKKEVYWRVFPHQDWRSMQGSLDAVVVWLPLVDIDRRLGALEVVPGSHRLGLLTTEVEDHFGKVDRFGDRDFVPVEVRQGDALFFSALLVHRSGENVSKSIRWSCHFRYNNLGENTFIDRGYPHPYVYQPQDDLITPRFPTTDLLKEFFRSDPVEAEDRQ